MRLKHIEIFNAVMLTGSASGAARLLHVTQPAVTQTLQHAELQLGYALFTRQRNRLVPTREALALYPEVQRLVSQLESVRRMSRALRRGEGSCLRILVVPSLAVRALPEALVKFRQRNSEVQVSIRTLHSREIVEAIALQEGEVGIVYGSLSHPAIYEELVAEGCLVCVSQAGTTEFKRRGTVELEEVLRYPFIRIDERDPLGAMLADQWSRRGLIPHPGVSVQTHHIAMVLAEEGFGPAIIDSFTARAHRCSTLEVRTLLPEVPVEIYAIMPEALRSQNAAGEFIEAFKAVIAGD